jgi:predicted small lipoprotein YifL
MKTIRAFLLTALLAPALVACGGKAPEVSKATPVLTDDAKLTIVQYEWNQDGTKYQDEMAVDVKCLSGTVYLMAYKQYGWMAPRGYWYSAYQTAFDDGMGEAFSADYGKQLRGIAQTALDQVCS